jgi:hypothetical protein
MGCGKEFNTGGSNVLALSARGIDTRYLFGGINQMAFARFANALVERNLEKWFTRF